MTGLYYNLILFLIMFTAGFLINPMNLLAYKITHLYPSITLTYTAAIMAFNMLWLHQLVHLIVHREMEIGVGVVGVVGALLFVYLARNQIGVDEYQWMRRMIPHHSTALTTTTALLKNRTENLKRNPKLFRLAKDIVFNQEKEIHFMKT